MAIIPQQTLFVWSEIENLGDLERLRLVIEYMPDEELMQVLEKERGKGRNDFPVRAMWNSILAGVVYQHPSIESLRRELSRNGQLRFMCGFRNKKIPEAYVYSGFFNKLFGKEEMINGIFNKREDELEELLPGFGKNLAIDGKAISSLAQRQNKSKQADGRRDLDADYELPVAFELTKASTSEVKQAHKMIDNLHAAHPEQVEGCETPGADRGYDDTKLCVKLWDTYRIKPVIDIRNMWRDKDGTRQLEDYENVVYNYKGNVYCVCMETGIHREMCLGGFVGFIQFSKPLKSV